MFKTHWTYFSEGRQHVVRLCHHKAYHNVKIALDNNLLFDEELIDLFKQYDFTIDDELCSVLVLGSDDGFDYEFRVNLLSNTVKGKDRKKNRLMTNLGIALLALFAISTFVYLGTKIPGWEKVAKQKKIRGQWLIEWRNITNRFRRKYQI